MYSAPNRHESLLTGILALDGSYNGASPPVHRVHNSGSRTQRPYVALPLPHAQVGGTPQRACIGGATRAVWLPQYVKSLTRDQSVGGLLGDLRAT